MDNVHVLMCLHILSIKSTAQNKTRFFPSPFLTSTSLLLLLAKEFGNNHVAACSTALRSATEEIEIGGYVTVPCSSKMTQCSSTADWLNFEWRHQIGCVGTHTEQTFTSEVKLCSNTCTRICKPLDTVNPDINYCTSQLKKVELHTKFLT